MIDITKKKLPPVIINILLYLSYCATNWYMVRGTMAYYGEFYGFPGWIANDIVAFIFGGLIAFAVYKIVSQFVLKTLILRVGNGVGNVKYGLDCTVIATNILLFGLKFIYFAVPLYAAVIDIIIVPTITIGCVALYLYYAFRQDYVDRSRYKIIVNNVLGAFLVAYGILTVLNLLLAVV